MFCSGTSLPLWGQVISIPDARFKVFCVDHYDTGRDGEISVEEALAVTGMMDCSGLELVDLTGIGAFRNIDALHCGFNMLARLPSLVGLSNLQSLSCEQNLLDQLPELSSLNRLAWLNCASNELEHLPEG